MKSVKKKIAEGGSISPYWVNWAFDTMNIKVWSQVHSKIHDPTIYHQIEIQVFYKVMIFK